MRPLASSVLVASLLLAPGALSSLSFADGLPDIGDTTSTFMSADEERRRGEAFMRQIRATLNVIEDPEIVEYVESLGFRLASSSDSPSQEFTFFVVEDPSINAFAAPGGFIGINTGLILATETEGELAAVLAHEIAHVTQRHLARAYEAASKMSIPTGAAVLAAVILGAQNRQITEAAIVAAAAGSVQSQINFTRAHEKEADRVGIQTLAQAGFDPRSMPAFFERLQQATRYYDSDLPEFLQTHPVTHARIADSMARAETYPGRQDTGRSAYRLVQAKLRVMQSSPAQAINYFREKLKDASAEDTSALRYGYVLALLADSQLDESRVQLDILLKDDPERLTYLLALAKHDLAQGNTAQAVAIHANAFKLFPYNYPLTIRYAEALLQDQQADRARSLLEEYSRRKKPTLPLYQLLARAEEASGQAVNAHQSLAEYYYLIGETVAAIEQLKIALKYTDRLSDYQRSRITARRDQFQAVLAQETAR
ncbi:MAG: peptidase M48 Ste24p [Gammaproteobacteria bacterium]|nr:MAG: peptidase M48 Ste24p [Gammaproteobacteria bacterium]TND03466.1 MAG: peptidase M48 Ste24p [Gammaproteobacteria bacterium]